MKNDLLGRKNAGANEEQSEINMEDELEFDRFREKDQQVVPLS
jgi:hypothetical protein